MYFFDTYDGDQLFTDAEGTACSADEVRDEATRLLLEIALDNISGSDLARKLTVVARDSSRAIAAEVSLTFRGQ